jgi:L-fuculose-phosphate aldolase
MADSILHKELREQVATTALSLLTTRLVVNTSGNVSIRVGEEIVITPSGTDYDSLSPQDICVVTMDGDWVDGELLPSSETPLHIAVYRSDPEIQAIVHTHSVHATAVTTLVDKLPAIHYQMLDLGGEVPVAPYATFGSIELAESVVSALPGYKAVLMKNHGSITVAKTLKKALARAVNLEWCCEVWLKAATAGKPSTLSKQQLELAKQQMKDIAEQRALPRNKRVRRCCD